MRLLNVHFFPVKIYLLFTWFFDIICCNVKNKLHDGSIGACVYSNQVTLFLIISSCVRTAVIAILNERSWTGWFRRSFVNIYTVLWFFYLIEYSKRFEIFTHKRFFWFFWFWLWKVHFKNFVSDICPTRFISNRTSW